MAPFLTLLLALSVLSPAVLPFDTGGVRQVQVHQIPAISHVEEDLNGMVWLLSEDNGFYGYDGANYVQYFPMSDHPESLSSYHVNCLYSDSAGRLWVGTQKGMDRMEEDRMGFRHYHVSGINNYIQGIFETSEGIILAWTTSHMLVYDPESDNFAILFPLTVEQRLHLNYTTDDYGRFWISTKNGVAGRDASFHTVRQIRVPGNIERMASDGQRTMYVVSGGRLSIWDTESETEVPLPSELEPMRSLAIRDIVRDGDRMVFLTDKGIWCYRIPTRTLSSSGAQDLPFTFSVDDNDLVSLRSDRSGYLWAIDKAGSFHKAVAREPDRLFSPLLRYVCQHRIITSSFNRRYLVMLLDDGKVITYDLAQRTVKYEWYLYQKASPLPVQTNWRLHSYHLSFFGDDRLVISDWTGSCIVSLSDGRKALSISCDPDENGNVPVLQKIIRASDGSFWGVGFSPAYWYSEREANGSIHFHKAGQVEVGGNIHSTALTELASGQIAMAFSDAGILLVNPSDHTEELVTFPEHYDQNYISIIQEDHNGNLWIGTTDWGLFRYSFEDRQMTQIPEFRDMRIWNICESAGNIHILAESSVFRYNRTSDDFSMIWSETSGSTEPINFFPFPDGSLIMDCHGSFEILQADKVAAPVLQDGPLNLILSTGDRVMSMMRLKAGTRQAASIRMYGFQENLSLSISQMGANSAQILFRYRVNDGTPAEVRTIGHSIPLYGLWYGVNNIWIQAGNLQAGTEGPEYLLKIVIPRPWYHWATLALALLGLAFLLIFWYQRNQRLKEAEAARQEKRMQEEVNMHNIDFFANISHEFRTPLTLIDGAADSLPDTPTEAAHMKQVIRRNTDRMLKLVSQMLDFNKLDHDMLRLCVAMNDAGAVIRRVAEQFRFGASQKDIDLQVNLPDSPALMWLDVDKMEKVLYNLLSNALKFTPPGGAITVTATVTDSPQLPLEASGMPYLQVSVDDTGVGIPEDQLTFIFERFAQTDAAKKSGGTGIGLYYTKSLVELHHGHIAAFNRNDLPEGKSGSSFRFALPMWDAAYTEEEKAREEDTFVSVDDKRSQSEYLVRESPDTGDDGKLKVLVIDDDYEMVYLLKTLLSPTYRVICRFDAMSGYQIIEREQPDLVLSDVMMVDVDGLQLCRMVKENLSICHIPVILLTAKSTMDDQIQGLHAGADAYLLKPFNKDYLMAMIQTQLENRHRVRKMFNTVTTPHTIDEGALSPLDKELMDKVFALMDAAMQKEEKFNMDDIAAQLSISRTKFYAKIKALTGQTPNDYFNVYRLNRAAELIREGQLKISAIASMVGFNSASHFATLFKKQFGVLPSQYLESGLTSADELT